MLYWNEASGTCGGFCKAQVYFACCGEELTHRGLEGGLYSSQPQRRSLVITTSWYSHDCVISHSVSGLVSVSKILRDNMSLLRLVYKRSWYFKLGSALCSLYQISHSEWTHMPYGRSMERLTWWGTEVSANSWRETEAYQQPHEWAWKQIWTMWLPTMT